MSEILKENRTLQDRVNDIYGLESKVIIENFKNGKTFSKEIPKSDTGKIRIGLLFLDKEKQVWVSLGHSEKFEIRSLMARE